MTNMINAGINDTMTTQGYSTMKPDSIGNVRGEECNSHGETCGVVTLTEVLYSKNTNFNLFSVTRMMQKSWAFNNDKDRLSTSKGNQSLMFYIKLTNSRGALYYMYLKILDVVETSTSGIDGRSNAVPRKMKINIKKSHEMFGHSNEDCTNAKAKVIGYEIVRGSMKPCESCGIAKERQKNVPQVSDPVIAKVPN